MGLYAEFLTVLDTKTCGYTEEGRAESKGGEEKADEGGGGLLTEQKHVVLTAHSS